MARIPQAEIERLKSEVSVERLVTAAGIELKRAGKDVIGRCPFHDDAEPSLVVTPAKNLWHCFGCQTGGGPIDWVMKMNGVSFRHAVELLREGITSLAAAPVKQGTIRKLPAPVVPDADDQALLNQVVGYYHETLKAAPEALAYLAARGIDAAEAIERHRLGFANRTLGLRLPNSQRVAGAAIRERLMRLGVYRASGHEHFNGSLVIPVIDETGNVTELYGRKILDNLRPGTAYHLYLPAESRVGARGVWNAAGLARQKEVILCEALIDALTFWCAGFRNVTSAYGIEGFTDEHLAAFKRHGIERVLIAYDRDQAGNQAADKLAARLIAEGLEAWRVEFPHGMDANEYALKVTPAAKSLGMAIRRSVWLGKGQAPVRSDLAAPQPAAAQPVAAQPVAPVLDTATPARADAASSLAAEAAKEKISEPLPATPVPPAPAPEVEAQVKESEVVLTFGENEQARRYRVRGLAKNLSVELMKVNLLVSQGEAFFVDTLDLYAARSRAVYVTQAAAELKLSEELIKHDLGRVLLKLEALQEAQLRKSLEPAAPAGVAIPERERQMALELLKSPDLIERILADLTACGLVGERVNKLVCYLAAVSRKLDSPLAVVIQSSSAAGKSSLMDAVLAMMPEEERVKYSAMTGQSLFYMGETNLKHKVLAIVEEQGASRAAYALKLLQSEGELTIASTGKDPATGNLVTQEYRVEGPVMIFLTTTAIEIDEELLNRCLVLSVDENRAQTKAIHRLQRERRTLPGLLARAAREETLALHRNAQRLLRPLAVVNPFADQLTFLDDRTRTRRDHEKYLTLIDVIALLNQHQRPVKTALRAGRAIEYVEATLEDIALANDLAHEVLGRSLDELPPQTRRLLHLIEDFVAECASALQGRPSDYRFSRRTLREAIGWGDTQLKIHLGRLLELEYVVAHREARAGFVYELVYDGAGKDGKPFVPGLIDVAALRCAYDASRSGVNAGRSGGSRPPVGPRSGGGRVDESAETPALAGVCGESSTQTAKTPISGGNGKASSYPQDGVVPMAAAARE